MQILIILMIEQFTIIINIIQYQMNRRIVYKEQAKCNFCYNWFQVFSEIKFGLNICQACIYKALNTSCFKLPTPQGHLYQVYLARRNISVNPSNQSNLLQKIDEFMHTQIRQLLEKWQEITKILKSLSPIQAEQQIWKRTEFILKNDAKNFNTFNSQTIQQIRQDLVARQKDKKIPCTPMREKGINMSVKYLNKSNKKLALNRMDSKKSLRSFREVNQNDKSATKVQNENEKQNIEDDPHRRQDTSPFSLGQMKRAGSTRGLHHMQIRQNKEFVAKMQLIKNNISATLQERHENTVNQPINILKQRIYEAIQNTNCINKCVEVVSYNGLQSIDMKCYLSNIQWEGVEVVKFVKVGLTDQQLQTILEFIKDKSVQTLVLTSNNLTQESIRNLLKAQVKSLHNIYLGKNQIFAHKAKSQIKQLRSKYNFFL